MLTDTRENRNHAQITSCQNNWALHHFWL